MEQPPLPQALQWGDHSWCGGALHLFAEHGATTEEVRIRLAAKTCRERREQDITPACPSYLYCAIRSTMLNGHACLTPTCAQQLEAELEAHTPQEATILEAVYYFKIETPCCHADGIVVDGKHEAACAECGRIYVLTYHITAKEDGNDDERSGSHESY